MSTPRVDAQSAVAVKCCPRCRSETCTDPDSKGCSDNCIGNYQEIIKQWETWGIIEIAVRNPQVAEWMEHWETRCLKAESELTAEREKSASARADAFAEFMPIFDDIYYKHPAYLLRELLEKAIEAIADKSESPNNKIEVNRAALHQVLQALVGPSHYIRELQATRHLPGSENPIDTLISEYNSFCEESS